MRPAVCCLLSASENPNYPWTHMSGVDFMQLCQWKFGAPWPLNLTEEDTAIQWLSPNIILLDSTVSVPVHFLRMSRSPIPLTFILRPGVVQTNVFPFLSIMVGYLDSHFLPSSLVSFPLWSSHTHSLS